jgi:ABC-2 type transport system ATP-binding protein
MVGPMASAPGISIRDLRVVRGGRRVLYGISASVPAGRVTGLLGPSGSGKTTLMRALVGTQVIESGQVELLGRPAGSAELRARVAYVTQAPAVYADLTTHENLRYFARILRVPVSRVDEAIDAVSLAGLADQVVSTMSGGERARVSLATALLGRPEVLVLDEPTVGLDPVLRRDLWRLFHVLADGGATVVVSSHVMDEAERCDELLFLREGRLLAAAPPDAIRARTGAADLEHAFLELVEAAAA